jgi:Peptidase family S41
MLDQMFPASEVYDCLRSVPFNAAVASRFLKYYSDTLQFQSTFRTLKDPPASYQQPAVDIQAVLDQIQSNIDQEAFQNYYEFEAAVHTLVHSTHDSHVSLTAGISAPFSFGSSYSIVSVSTDGFEIPKVYFTGMTVYISMFEQLLNSVTADLLVSAPDYSKLPPAITMINNVDVTKWLSDFATQNSYGTVEPHSDWNQLMASPAGAIQDISSVFEGATTLYPGDTLNFTFEGGEMSDNVPWWASYNGPEDVGPLTTGGDFFNFFVLGHYPAVSSQGSRLKQRGGSGLGSSHSPTRASVKRAPQAVSSPALQGWSSPAGDAYPVPAIVQTPLDPTGYGGVLTAYFLEDVSTAVLSIPSFYAINEYVDTFSQKVREFIQHPKTKKMAKIVIDVQQNDGGLTFLAIDTFKQVRLRCSFRCSV